MKSESLKLQEKRSELKKLIKEDDKSAEDKNEILKQQIYVIEMELGEENARANHNKIKSLEALNGESDCMNVNGTWKLKKKIFRKIAPQGKPYHRRPQIWVRRQYQS